MMIAKPSPNPRSARAPYRQRISGGVLVEEKTVIDKSATWSGGSKCCRRTCLTSEKWSETTLGCVTADRAVADGPNIMAVSRQPPASNGFEMAAGGEENRRKPDLARGGRRKPCRGGLRQSARQHGSCRVPDAVQ